MRGEFIINSIKQILNYRLVNSIIWVHLKEQAMPRNEIEKFY